MSDDELDDLTVVPMPTSETQAEHDRIRQSNDRDQQLERDGKESRHNRGVDEAANETLPNQNIDWTPDE